MIKRTLATVLALLILAATFSVPISVSASNVVKCDKCGGDGLFKLLTLLRRRLALSF